MGKRGKKKFDYLVLWEIGKPKERFEAYETLADISREIGAKEMELIEKEEKRREVHPMEREGAEYRAADVQTIHFTAKPRDYSLGRKKRKQIQGEIMSVRDFVYEGITDGILEGINEKYPNIYDRSKPMFQKIKEKHRGKSLYEMRQEIRALGNEEKIETLRHRCFFDGWIKRKSLEIAEKYAGWTFVHNERDDWSVFIVGGLETAEKIKMGEFFRDFYSLEQPVEYIRRDVAKAIRKWLKKQIKEIENG